MSVKRSAAELAEEDEIMRASSALAKALLASIPPGTQARVATGAGAILLVSTMMQLRASRDAALRVVAGMWDAIDESRTS